MQQLWTTKEADLEVAEQIINKHIELNEGEPLGLFELILHDEKIQRYELADWLIELSDHYNELYGDERGLFVTKMIISRCMIGDATLH